MSTAVALLVATSAVACSSETAGVPLSPASSSSPTSGTASPSSPSSGTASPSSPTIGTASSSSPSSGTASPSSPDTPRLVLDVALPAGSSWGGQQLAAAVSGVVGDVDSLPDRVRDAPDVFVGSLGSAASVTIVLPGTTAAQRDAVRQALVGRWAFALRPVVSSAVDQRACAALTARPRADRVCDPATQQVLVLGDALDVRADGARVDAVQGGPAVAIALTAATRPALERWTAAHVGERLAVTDGRGLVTAPTVQAAITTSELLVQGNFTEREAGALAGRLQLAAGGAVVTTAG